MIAGLHALDMAGLVALLALAHHYLFYPLLVILLSRLKPMPSVAESPGQWPSVTLIIAAYNEEKVIARKIENSLALDYPPDRLEIMVVSDGSSDNTATIVERFADRGVRSLHTPERGGKTAALNRGVAEATGEILLFSDANNDYNANALKALVRHFADAAVGGVCGAKRIYAAEGRESSEGDSLYWRMESAIKSAESRFRSINNGDGEIFAVRKKLYVRMDETVINDDAELTLIMLRQGYRVLYETAATSHEYASIDIRDDFHVKVRMVAGGFQTLARHFWRLLPPRDWMTFSFFSHKVLRWLSPLLLIVVMIASVARAGQPWVAAFLAAQLVCYGLALLGWLLRGRQPLPTPIYVPFYFCTMNLAALFGLMRFLKGSQKVQWRKAQR